MREAMLRVVFFWLILFIVMQPILSHIDYFLDLHVRATAAYIAEKAAPEGMVTPELYEEAIDMLTAIGFVESQIEIDYVNSIHERGDRIDVIIKIPREKIFLFDFINQDPGYYYARSTVMSEYLR